MTTGSKAPGNNTAHRWTWDAARYNPVTARQVATELERLAVWLGAQPNLNGLVFISMKGC